MHIQVGGALWVLHFLHKTALAYPHHVHIHTSTANAAISIAAKTTKLSDGEYIVGKMNIMIPLL